MVVRLSVIGLFAAACGSSGGGDGPLDTGGFVVAPGMENQGRKLLGAGLDDHAGADPAHHISFLRSTARDADGRSIPVDVVGGGALRSGSHRGKDAFFNGVVIETGDGSEVELTVDPDAKGGRDVAQYRLLLRDAAGGASDPCNGEPAVPLFGTWTTTGSHEADRTRLSFACADGVAFKCLHWGYAAGVDPKAEGWQAHQACTRMARADYCGVGKPNTREGTEVWIFDNLGNAPVPSSDVDAFNGIERFPPALAKHFFESAWPIGDGPAVCLSRMRWQSLTLHGKCGDDISLPDPRDGIGQFCDDLGAADGGVKPPTLFIASRFADLALHVWQSGDDRVTTIRGFYDPSLPDVVRAPFPNAGEYTYNDTDEGMLFREIPPDQPAEAFLEVKIFFNLATNDHVLARAEDRLPPEYTPLDGAQGGFEGYVRKGPGRGGKELVMYRHPTTHDFWSTTDASAATAAGYVSVGLVGYTRPRPDPLRQPGADP